MKVTITENPRNGSVAISIGDLKLGSFDEMDGRYSYYPSNTHRMSGDHFIAIGKALNSYNKSKGKNNA